MLQAPGDPEETSTFRRPILEPPCDPTLRESLRVSMAYGHVVLPLQTFVPIWSQPVTVPPVFE